MNISQRIIWELDRQGKKQKDLSAFTGISTSAISAWNKNNSQPASEKLSLIADFLEVSLEYLITGQEECKMPKLHRYRWDFMEDTEEDKFYNKVIYSLHMLHGSMKANAMLSAVGLPADKTTNIDDTILKWLADKSQTITDFFTDGHFETGKLDVQSLKRLAEGYTYYDKQGSDSLRADYPEMRTWDENYVYLFNVAVEESTNSEYIAEIFEAFKCYPNEHADLMAYIRQGIDNFEEARKKRLDRRNASMNAQKEETA